MAIAAAALVAVAAGAVVLDRGPTAAAASEGTPAAYGGRGAGGEALGSATFGNPVVAATRLTLARVTANAAAEPGSLAQLTVLGSPAWWADRAAARQLVARGPVGTVAAQVVSAVVVRAPRCERVVPRGPAARGGVVPPAAVGAPGCVVLARVAVTVEVDVGDGPARSAVVLVLQPTPGGWRVGAVEPCAPGP